ncbi:MAG TPA: Imm44 family immunity protein [Polyangium sp.]|nr:Imm44 family immunity protein [Polyangium sp.]
MQTKLWTSTITDPDVSDDCSAAETDIKFALNEALNSSSYGALKEWIFIPIIMSPPFNLTPDKETKKYRKKSQEFEFRLNIDHATFKSADAIGHRKLIVAALLRCIDEMRKLVPKGIDYDRLEQDVCNVAITKGWLPDPGQEMAAHPAAPPIPEGDVVKKLYKRIKGVLHYEKAWTYEGSVTHHWGKVGQEGKFLQSPLEGKRPYDVVQTVLAKAMARGFAEIPDEKLQGFVVQYKIDEFGATEDLNKLHALEDRLDEMLERLGLGYCDGNSIGSGTMEVFCYVVDLPLAMERVKEILSEAPYANDATITMLENDDDA